MADPMSLGIACVALLAQIAELTKVLTDFVKAVRSARKDIQGFSKELASLEQAVSSLRDEAISVPELVKANVTQILKQCQSVTQDMQHILQKHQRKGAGFSQKLQWTLNDAAEVTKLRERLEPHKTGLQIALSAAILHQSNSVKEDTTAIRGHTSVSVAEIVALRREVAELRRALRATPNSMLQRYLEQATEYSESVAGSLEAMDDCDDVTGLRATEPRTLSREGHISFPSHGPSRDDTNDSADDLAEKQTDDPLHGPKARRANIAPSTQPDEASDITNHTPTRTPTKEAIDESAGPRLESPVFVTASVDMPTRRPLDGIADAPRKKSHIESGSPSQASWHSSEPYSRSATESTENYPTVLLHSKASPIQNNINTLEPLGIAADANDDNEKHHPITSNETECSSKPCSSRSFVPCNDLGTDVTDVRLKVAQLFRLCDKEAVLFNYFTQATTWYENCSSEQSAAGLRWLLDRGVPVNQRLTMDPSAGSPRVHTLTPLQFVAKDPDLAHFIPVLVQAGADIEATTVSGSTPVLLALKHNNRQGIRHLRQAGASLSAIDLDTENLKRLSGGHLLSSLATQGDFAQALSNRYGGKTVLAKIRCSKQHRHPKCGTSKCPAWISKAELTYPDLFESSYSDLLDCFGLRTYWVDYENGEREERLDMAEDFREKLTVNRIAKNRLSDPKLEVLTRTDSKPHIDIQKAEANST